MSPPGDSSQIPSRPGGTQELKDKPDSQENEGRNLNEVGNEEDRNERKDPMTPAIAPLAPMVGMREFILNTKWVRPESQPQSR